jgi:6-pyruvoyltetrahydropterin/6-carboxytetrahydropterin synthase
VTTTLRRTTRFALRPGAGPSPNTFAGSPHADWLRPYVECTVECAGRPDPASGYLINIKAIDDAVHAVVRPLLEDAIARPESQRPPPGELLACALRGLADALPVPVRAVEVAISPYHHLSMSADSPRRAALRLRFDFAASHRLHVPEWDDQANREYFGKCNHPNGHGHNYQLETRVEVDAQRLGTFSTEALERLVKQAVVDRFDHKHLNLDTEEFSDDGGANPTVENIARVCFELLREPVAALGPGTRLASVTVWETDRTASEYPATPPAADG